MVEVKISRILGSFALGACLSAFAGASAFATEPDSSSLSYQDWTVNCANPTIPADPKAAPAGAPVCEMVQSFMEKDNHRLVARIAIGRPKAGADMRLVILAPVGVWLPDGASLNVSDKVQAKAPFLRCSPAACFAEIDAKKDFLEGAKTAEKMTLVFSGGANQPVTMNVSTKGFAAALAALDKK